MRSLRPTSTLRIAAGCATVCLLTISSAAYAAADPAWTTRRGSIGNAEISADRTTVSLCDMRDDDQQVGVEYQITYSALATGIPFFTRTVLLQAGPHSKCVDDSIWLGKITAARFCDGHGDLSHAFPYPCDNEFQRF